MSYNGRESGSINGRQPPLGQYIENARYVVFKDGDVIKVKSGKDGSIDFSGTDASTVIQNAIDALGTAGGSLFFKKGTYTLEPTKTKTLDGATGSFTAHIAFSISSNISLVGEKGAVLEKTPTQEGEIAVEVPPGTKDASIEDLTIRATTSKYDDNYLVHAHGESDDIVRNFTINRCKLEKSYYGVLFMHYVQHSGAYNNYCHNIGHDAFHSYAPGGGDCRSCTWEGNRIYNCGQGVNMEDVLWNTAVGNVIRGGGFHGIISQKHPNIIVGNTITGKDEIGIFVRYYASRTVVANNFIKGVGEHGIYIYEGGDDILVEGNMIYNPDQKGVDACAIYAEDSSDHPLNNLIIANNQLRGSYQKRQIKAPDLNGSGNVIVNNGMDLGSGSGYPMSIRGGWKTIRGENLLESKVIRYNIPLTTWDNPPVATSGTGGGGATSAGWQAYTGNASGSEALVEAQIRAQEDQGIEPKFTWDRRKVMKVITGIQDASAMEASIVIGRSGWGGTWTQKHVGFYILNNEIHMSVGDGTNRSHSQVTTFSAGDTICFRTEQIPGDKALFWVNGSKVGELTTNLPSGLFSDIHKPLSLYITNNEAVDKRIEYATEFWYLQLED